VFRLIGSWHVFAHARQRLLAAFDGAGFLGGDVALLGGGENQPQRDVCATLDLIEACAGRELPGVGGLPVPVPELRGLFDHEIGDEVWVIGTG